MPVHYYPVYELVLSTIPSTASFPLPRQIQFIQHFFVDHVIGNFALQ